MVKEAAGDRSLGPKTQPVQRQRTQKQKMGVAPVFCREGV